MGLFKFRKYHRRDDLVFKTDHEKTTHFIHALEKTSSADKATVAFVHFKDSKEVLEQKLKNYRFFVFKGTWERSKLSKIINTWGNEIFIITTDFLRSLQNSPVRLEKTHSSPLKLNCFAFEHYPVISRDKLIFDFLENLPVKSEISFYVSLEEPLLRNYTSDQFISTMETLGFNQGYVKSPLLTKSIENLQKKIEKKVKQQNRGYVETSVNSSLEWFKYNFHQSDLF